LHTLVEYCEGEREQARNLFRAIDRHHRRSRHPPRLFDPATAEYYPNPDYS
jgi:hypothetical protein